MSYKQISAEHSHRISVSKQFENSFRYRTQLIETQSEKWSVHPQLAITAKLNITPKRVFHSTPNGSIVHPPESHEVTAVDSKTAAREPKRMTKTAETHEVMSTNSSITRASCVGKGAVGHHESRSLSSDVFDYRKRVTANARWEVATCKFRIKNKKLGNDKKDSYKRLHKITRYCCWLISKKQWKM